MKRNRLVAFALTIFLILSMMAGCAAPARPGTSDPQHDVDSQHDVPANKKLVVGSDTTTRGFSPVTIWGASEYLVATMIYEPLATFDENNELVGITAKSWTKTDDEGKEWDIEIFDYIYDTDGNHITAADIIGFYQNCMDEKYSHITRELEAFELTGEFTLHVKLREATSENLPNLLSNTRVYSQKAYQESEDKFITRPVGTMNYRVTDFQVGGNVTIKKTDTPYWQTDASLIKSNIQLSNVDEVVIVPLVEAFQQATAVETGTIDMMKGMSSSVIGKFENNSAYTVIEKERIMTKSLYFSGAEGKPVADNRNLRLAICHAIDAQGLMDIVVGGRGVPNKSFTSADAIGFNQKWLDEDFYEYDVEKAKTYLEESGYKPGELHLKLLTAATDEWQKIAQVVQSYLREIGIEVEIEALDGALFASAKNDPTRYDMTFNQVGGNFYIGNITGLMSQQSWGGSTFSGIVDDKLEALIQTCRYDTAMEADFDNLHYYLKDAAYIRPFYDSLVGYVFKADAGIKSLAWDWKAMDILNAIEFA